MTGHYYAKEVAGGYEIVFRMEDSEEQIGWIPNEAIDDVIPYLISERKIADVTVSLAGMTVGEHEVFGDTDGALISVGILPSVDISVEVDPVSLPEP